MSSVQGAQLLILRIWEDFDRDAVTDAGELKTLDEHGIASISLATQDPEADWIAGNQIAAEGSFTRSDGTSGTVSDVRFRIDNFDTTYLGDKTVSAEAALLPNVKGRGTLTDLHIAMTQNPTLLATVQATMPTLTAFDLPTLRDAITPILADWAAPDTTMRPTIPILISVDEAGNRDEVLDFGIPLDDGSWALASGDEVTDASGAAIAEPGYGDIVDFFARTGTLEELTSNSTTSRVDVVLRWDSLPGRRYDLQGATSLLQTVHWSPVPDATNLNGTGSEIEVILDASETPYRYFRLRARQ